MAPPLAFDLRELARRRWQALRSAFWQIALASVAATLAWWLAQQIPHHPRPFFAPIAAVIAMIQQPGTRGRQAIGLMLGVVIGIGVAALVIAVAGTGTWQLGLAAALAMPVAILVEGRPIVIGQAAASAVLLVALHRPGAAPGRLLDALIGGGVAILLATVLFPIDPLVLLGNAARGTREDLAWALDELTLALRRAEADRARRALAVVDAVDTRTLDDALQIARGVVRRAPRRRWERRAVEAYVSIAQELHAARADAHGVATGALRALRDEEAPVPPAAAEAVEALAAALRAGSAPEAEAAVERAIAAARFLRRESSSLGLGVFAHAVETAAAHVARAAAAAADAHARRGRRAGSTG